MGKCPHKIGTGIRFLGVLKLKRAGAAIRSDETTPEAAPYRNRRFPEPPLPGTAASRNQSIC